MTLRLLTLALPLLPCLCAAQYWGQYFDGGELPWGLQPIQVIMEGDENVWQIGPPSKVLFNAPYTSPNVLITDTVADFPPVNVSHARFTIPLDQLYWTGILAVQWMQKLDYVEVLSGGSVEFSIDGGDQWLNAFDSPIIYDFYGFQQSNAGVLWDDTPAFTGTDTTWRNIWFCMDQTWLNATEVDSLHIRFTHRSNTPVGGQEGWMIDNLYVALTMAHTVKEMGLREKVKVHPNPSQGRIHVEFNREDPGQLIREILVMDAAGRTIQRLGISPARTWLDLTGAPAGTYLVKVRTDEGEHTVPIILSP